MSTFIIIFCFSLLLIVFFIYSSTLVTLFLTSVPFVSSPKNIQKKVLEIAQIKPGEKVYDLGCGKATLLIEAEKIFKAQVLGFEISPWPYFLARLNILLSGSDAKVLFKDFFKADLSQANVIFCYLIPSVCKKLTKKLDQELTSKTKVISYAFRLTGWKAKVRETKIQTAGAPIYLYQKL